MSDPQARPCCHCQRNVPIRAIDKLQPHYFQTFQRSCCDPWTDGSLSNVLPIPISIKENVTKIVEFVNGFVIERLDIVSRTTKTIPNEFFLEKDTNQINRFLIDWALYYKTTDMFLINWAPMLNKVYPIRTSGNGNCLLHAVLIATVGIHDQHLYLRDLLMNFIERNRELLKDFWLQSRIESDKYYGIDSDQDRLDRDWKDVCDIVSYQNSPDGEVARQLRFLEAIHIFSISNLLRRPVIILSDSYVRGIDDQVITYNDLYGIYLPILNSVKDCWRDPIVLIYDQYHFCPLLTKNILNDDDLRRNMLPLYQSLMNITDQTILPIRFSCTENDPSQAEILLSEYLDLQRIPYKPEGQKTSIELLCVHLGISKLNAREDIFLAFAFYCQDFFNIRLPEAVEDFHKMSSNYVSPPSSKPNPKRSIVTHVINVQSDEGLDDDGDDDDGDDDDGDDDDGDDDHANDEDNQNDENDIQKNPSNRPVSSRIVQRLPTLKLSDPNRNSSKSPHQDNHSRENYLTNTENRPGTTQKSTLKINLQKKVPNAHDSTQIPVQYEPSSQHVHGKVSHCSVCGEEVHGFSKASICNKCESDLLNLPLLTSSFRMVPDNSSSHHPPNQMPNSLPRPNPRISITCKNCSYVSYLNPGHGLHDAFCLECRESLNWFTE